MIPFMRRVASLALLRAEGTDEIFFSGPDYIEVPKMIVDPLNHWCFSTGIPSISLGSKGATTEEPIEVFVLMLAEKDDKAALKRMIETLAPVVTSAVHEAAQLITPDIALTSRSNDAFDRLGKLASLHDGLLKFTAKGGSKDDDPALLIGI